MRGVLVDLTPTGLRLWKCDRCGGRQWFHNGAAVTDDEAVAVAAEHDSAGAVAKAAARAQGSALAPPA